MSELTYGSYLVKETKAPEGFYLDDNAYYFEITEDGKTVTVENEAGRGFVNAPQVGSLKIIKTSSDGKIEGFSFRVTGPNGYVGVFTTDKNGEIIIENLRIGEYVVSEVSDGASSAYVLPADKTASVFEGAVTKVEMHNELRDTPKTGNSVCSTIYQLNGYICRVVVWFRHTIIVLRVVCFIESHQISNEISILRSIWIQLVVNTSCNMIIWIFWRRYNKRTVSNRCSVRITHSWCRCCCTSCMTC